MSYGELERKMELTSEVEVEVADDAEVLYPDSAYGSSALDTDTEDSKTQSTVTLTYDEDLTHKVRRLSLQPLKKHPTEIKT